ncbi:MAG: 30S ribosomal protein S20 [Mycoplasmataceae bacterium]|nr:30S ribosomal protein S20 [Mycoplasmataceae bacterium]
MAKATARNKAIKSRVKLSIKNARIAIDNNDKDIKVLISKAKKEIQTAVSKGAYHKNNGARKQARLDAYAKRTTATK